MKGKRILPLSAMAFLCACSLFTGCKTTEANYRQAYEAAVTHREESTGLDSTIYSRIRNSARTSCLVVGADSLPVRTEYIGITKDGGLEKNDLRRYSVVVGQFKQIFNARQMRERLVGSGYTGTFIVQTREPLYYVAVATSDTPADILAEWKRVTTDDGLVLRAPLPFVLVPAHLAR
ncbi:MAG: hypothetical protein K2H88_00495 [Duncaniella sp.]|nr:hypothetical protein [Duncaniella sp.]MDE6171246.1 hypothetical protein [Duncaniella sp.]